MGGFNGIVGEASEKVTFEQRGGSNPPRRLAWQEVQVKFPGRVGELGSLHLKP